MGHTALEEGDHIALSDPDRKRQDANTNPEEVDPQEEKAQKWLQAVTPAEHPAAHPEQAEPPSCQCSQAVKLISFMSTKTSQANGSVAGASIATSQRHG